MSDLGTYLDHDGRPAVRFVRTYPHPIDQVWDAVAQPDRAAQWFPSALAIEPRIGGTVTFAGDPHLPDSTGVVLAWDPPRAVAFTWGDNEVHLRLAPTDGGCEFTLINVLGSPDEAARNAAGWTVCLESLDLVAAGRPSAGPHEHDAERSWAPHYAAYIAAGMPSGAPLPE